MSRLLARAAHDEDGTSLIEAVVAIGIIVMISLALLSTASALTLSSFANRTRAQATGLGSRYIETARTLAFGDLKVLDDGTFGAPNNVDSQGHPVQLCALPCTLSGHQLPYLTHVSAVTYQGTAFTVTQAVYGVDDSADGLAAADADAVTTDYKLITVKVAWSKPKAGTYNVQTIVHNTDAIPDPVIAGVRVEVVDSNGDIIADPNGDFSVEITGSGTDDSGDLQEGVYQDLNLPDGSYSCTVTSTNYVVAGTAATYSTTVNGLSVNAASSPVALCQTTWSPSTTCSTSGSAGSLTVTVTDGNGAAIPGAVVRLTNSSGANPVPDQSTGAAGTTTFASLPPGAYGIVANATPPASTVTLVQDSAKASACVTPGAPATAVTASGTVQQSNTGGSLSFTASVLNKKASTNFELQVTGPDGSKSVRDFTLGSGKTSAQQFPAVTPGQYTVALYTVTIKKGESPLLNLLYTWPTSAPSTGTDFSGSVGQVCTFGYTYNTTSVPTSVTCS